MSPKSAVPRAVAIAVAVQSREPDYSDAQVCLVSSRKHKDAFVLPKGGVERGESPREAAARELWEEAGVRAPLALPPGAPTEALEIPDTKPHKHSPSADAADAAFVPATVYSVHEFVVAPEHVEAKWPEAKERVRLFVPPAEARERVAWRRGMADALQRASCFRL